MNQEVMLRIRSPSGLQRLNISLSSTYNELKAQIEKLTGIPIKDQIIRLEKEANAPLNVNGLDKLSKNPKFEDGLDLWVKSTGTYTPIQIGEKKDPPKVEQKPVEQKKPVLVNASGKIVEEKPEEKKKVEETKEERAKKKKEKKKEEEAAKAKHVTFEHYAKEMKIKTGLMPSNISYKMKLNCTYHPPYPQAMCNKCMPPSAIIKRQEFRHVDYAQFMNTQEIGNFVNSWMQTGCSVQRGGILYGYYAEDPNYADGVRAIIEAIYEPPQQGEVTSFEFLPDNDQNVADMIAGALGLERIGWIFTSIDGQSFLTSYETKMAAKLQELHKVEHPCGYTVSKFITVVMRYGKEGSSEIVPDVYMVSDQCQALERDEIFGEPDSRKELKIREPVETHDILPTVICEGKQTKSVLPDFFIVNIAHGRPKSNKFSIVKHSDFPVENRPTIQQKISDVKNYLKKFSKEPGYTKFSDFHLLLYIAKILDLDTALNIADAVKNEQEVSSGVETLLDAMN